MDIQRLRNLTTGLLHTNIGHVYEDIEYFTGQHGVMTHMLPNAMRALEPYLREQIDSDWLWDGEFDQAHTGDIAVPPMNEQEETKFWRRYRALPSPLEGKTILPVVV